MSINLSENNDSIGFSFQDSYKLSIVQDSLSKKEKDTSVYIGLYEIFSVFKKEHPQRESLFTHHYLPKKTEIKPIGKTQGSDSWVFGILIGIAILFCWIFWSYRVRVSQMFYACFTNRRMNMLMKGGNVLKEMILPFIAITYLTLFSLFIYKLAKDYSFSDILPPMRDYVLYLLIFGGLTMLSVLKFVIVRFIGNVFRSDQISILYLVNDLIFDFLLAISLFPLLFLMFFAHIDIVFQPALAVIILISIIFIVKTIRGFLLTLTYSKFSKLYLFYYLCSIEILPVLIFGKILFSQGN